MNDTEPTITDVLSAINELSTGIDLRFDRVDARLESIERVLWQGERLQLIEERITRLAEETGHPELAVPIAPPLGQK